MRNLRTSVFRASITIVCLLCFQGFAVDKIIPVSRPVQDPDHNNLCWAYCAQSFLHWYAVPVSFSSIWQHGADGVDRGIPLQGSCSGTPPRTCECILEYFAGINMTYYANDALHRPYADYVEYINSEKLIFAGVDLRNGNSGGHALLVCGYDNTEGLGNLLYVYDPSDPYRLHSYRFEIFKDGPFHTLQGALFPSDSPPTNFPSTGEDPEANAAMRELSVLSGGIITPPITECIPWIGDPGCNLVGCNTNVHNQSDLHWFSNTPGHKVEIPVPFSKTGEYDLILTCRGSICNGERGVPWTYSNNGLPCDCHTLDHLGNLVKVSLTTQEVNRVSGTGLISGNTLKTPSSSHDWAGCEAYSHASVYPIEPASKDVTIPVVIESPGVELVRMENVFSGGGIAAFSLHGIKTVWKRDVEVGIPPSRITPSAR
jgi:hypothetical protein